MRQCIKWRLIGEYPQRKNGQFTSKARKERELSAGQASQGIHRGIEAFNVRQTAEQERQRIYKFNQKVLPNWCAVPLKQQMRQQMRCDANGTLVRHRAWGR